MLKPTSNGGVGRWQKISSTVNKLGAFRKTKIAGHSQLDALEDKFCSQNTKRQLAHSSGRTVQAAYYTKPSEQSNSLGALSKINSRHVTLPPLTSNAAKKQSSEDKEAIHRRLKRRRSTTHGVNIGHNGASMDSSNTPKILTDEDRFRLRLKFRGLVRVFLVFKRIWLFHKGRVDEILRTFNGLDALVKTPVDQSELLFNVAQFKTKKQSVVSLEVKRILSKHPTMRTPDDIHALIVFMGSYDTLAEYPMAMQRRMAQKAWYEWYDAKRVITREGHVAFSFFYILSGSAVMTSFDQQATQSKTVKFVSRGESFGDSCIINGHPRESTAISKEFIELLVLRDEDFAEIFMSGGQNSSSDTFLETLSFMDGWPVEVIQTSTTRSVFTYYKKGTVIVSDSTSNDFIYIVKSGSCSVLKKLKGTDLHEIDAELISGKKTIIKEHLMERIRDDPQTAVDEEKLRLSIRLQSLVSKQTSNKDVIQNLIYYDPDIRVPMNGVLEELRGMKQKAPLPPITRSPSGTANSSAQTGDNDADPLMDVDFEASIQSVELAQCSDAAPDSIEMGHPTSAKLEDIPEESEDRTSAAEAAKETRKRGQVRFSGACTEKPDVFIKVQHLKAGSHFGLIEAIADNTITHPMLSLVSHGAECAVIPKKLFMDHAPLKLLDKLREELFPYPSDERLQQNLEVSMFWDTHKQSVINTELVSLKARQHLSNIR